MLTLFALWLAGLKAKRDARHAAIRHMAVIAHAVYTGSTGAYTLTPDLPRAIDSTEITWPT
jgi:hypothetical protein